MSRENDRRALVHEINAAARLYNDNLVGKRFMYVFDNRYIEVIYERKNFKHLTGTETNLSANEFFKKAVRGQLASSQIWFSSNHPYQLSVRKVRHLCGLVQLVTSASFILEEITTDSEIYKFGTTNLDFTLCLNRKKDILNNYVSDCYVVYSLRDEDCFSKCRGSYTVTHIFSRPNDSKKYNRIDFMDENANLASLPSEIQDLLDEKLIN